MIKQRNLVLVVLGLFIVTVVAVNLFYLPSIGISGLEFAPLTNYAAALEAFAKPTTDISSDNLYLGQESRGEEAESLPLSSPLSTDQAEADSSASAKADVQREETAPAGGAPGERIAGLNCDRFGGPPEETAAEMVYWRDIPSDAHFTSPYASYGDDPKYLTFEPDEGGFNNIRMSMETATAMAHAMGRILVLPPEQEIYLLGNDEKKHNNRFTFKKFFPFDAISVEHKAVEVISMEEFMEREVSTGRLKDENGNAVFPPRNQTSFEGHIRRGQEMWHWLRSVTVASTCDFSQGPYVFPKQPGPEGVKEMQDLFNSMDMNIQNHKLWKKYVGNPTPVDAPAKERLSEMLSFRSKVCLYDDHMQKAKVMHFMGDNASGARLLVHFYAFMFFEDWKQDLWTKRYVRDHLRYIDEIQCAAARIVAAVRERAIANGNPDGEYDSMHIRRGDFQYKQTRIDAKRIYKNIKHLFPANATVFVATDERDKSFFEPLRKHYNVLFFDDFAHLVADVNKNYYGMLDQRIASRGRTFAGAYYSTFTGYINRMRGYHSQKNKLEGYEEGRLNSFFYVPKDLQDDISVYSSLKGPLWGREFPVSWRDIDHDLSPSQLLA